MLSKEMRKKRFKVKFTSMDDLLFILQVGTDAIFCIRLVRKKSSPSLFCWFLISMNVSCTTKTNQKKSLFYFHKFNFLLPFCWAHRESEESVCRGHKDIHVIIRKKRRRIHDSRKHRIRFRANLLALLSFSIFFFALIFVYYLWNSLTTSREVWETSVDFLIISVRLRLESYFLQHAK